MDNNTEDLLKKIQEYEYKLNLMNVFQEFLININKKIEIDELAHYITNFIKESFNVKFCSLIINHERFARGEIDSEKLQESESRMIKEVTRKKDTLFVRNIRKDTLLFDLKNELELALMTIPILDESKIIACLNIYDDLEKINGKEIELMRTFLNKASLALSNSIKHSILKNKVNTDNLTGLYNRNYFMEKLNYELNTFKKFLSLIMLDIDFFKNYNDVNGHQAGDSLLKELALIINANVRDKDIIGRYGGEEFIIILPEADNSSALQICERLRKAVEDFQRSKS